MKTFVTLLLAIIGGSYFLLEIPINEARRTIFVTPLNKRPHIVFILMDDMGWSDVSFNGGEISTPNIDKLAYSGIILNNYYVQKVCAPTRVALFTGRVPEVEVGLNSPLFQLASHRGMPLEHKTLSEELQELGYVTHMVGKWHLGSPSWDYAPLERGFDTFFGILCARLQYYTHDDVIPKHAQMSCDGKKFELNGPEWGNCLFDGQKSVGHEYVGQYSTDMWTDRTIERIQEHGRTHTQTTRKKPMFLFLSHNAVHSPWQAPMHNIYSPECRDIEYINRRIMCGMLQVVDDGVGKIVDALEANGMLRNTVIIFSSDNGGAVWRDKGNVWGTKQAQNNYPLRGGKDSWFEGGNRVPGFIWGEHVHQDSYRDLMGNRGTSRAKAYVNNELFSVRDWPLTIRSLAGANVSDYLESYQKPSKNPNNVKLVAAYNQLAQLKKRTRGPRTEMIYDISTRKSVSGAIRNQEYKLILGPNTEVVDGWFDASNLSNSITHCMDPQECSQKNPDQYFFKISEDETEAHPLDIDNLAPHQQRNYDELSHKIDLWMLIRKQPLLYPDNITGPWDMELDAQGLPRFWNCSFQPFYSSSNFVVHPEDKCSDNKPNSCEVRNKNDWKIYSG